jgi:hypothetical protein
VTKEEICMALTPALVSRATDLKAFGTKINEKSALSLLLLLPHRYWWLQPDAG